MTTPASQLRPDAMGGTRMQPPPETLQVPLRFGGHGFEAHCYNTLTCSVIYDNDEFTRWLRDKPSGPPKPGDYRKSWSFASTIGIRNFPPPPRKCAGHRWMAKSTKRTSTSLKFSRTG